MQRAKIVCTIGPASSDRAVLRQLIHAGMNVARLNFSHGAHADHQQVYDNVRAEAEAAGAPVAILQDLQGPKIRMRRFEGGQATLETGALFRLVTEPIVGDQRQASITYDWLDRDASPGEMILLDDGLIALEVTETGPGWVETVVRVGGVIRDNKGVNLPQTRVTVPSLTEKDRSDLAFGAELGVDYVALSFVRSSLDIHQVRAWLERAGSRADIIAKIEKPEAVDALVEIVAAADGVMIARGDLGVELPPEQVPIIQKRAIDLANELGRVSITATQMLESMTHNPRPTRAEASDVANAIYDGTDAVMLSGETAVGSYPVETVAMMSRIIEEAENSPFYRRPLVTKSSTIRSQSESIARATAAAAAVLDAAVIACFTMSGKTPRLIKGHRPSQTVLAFTPIRSTFNKLALHRGITPVLTELRDSTDGLIRLVEEELRREKLVKPGDHAVIVMGVPVGTGAPANLIKYHQIDD